MVININDDRMIMEFLSGRYLGVPDGHAVYMNYPLTGMLAGLYRAFPNVDWYGYFLAAVMCLCIGLAAYRVWEMEKSRGGKGCWMLLAAFGICTFAMGREFFSVTYTTVAAISGATAVFWYGTSKGKKTDVMITAVLAALTWCIRDELFLMIIPAAGLIWILKELPTREKIGKKLILPAAVFGSVAVCMLINQMMYSGGEWKEYQRFNQLRTEIFDYQDSYYFPNYEEYRAYYERLGLTNEERRMLIYYDFTLLKDQKDVNDVSELFEQMIEIRGDYGANGELLPLKQRIPEEFVQFVKNTLTGAYGRLYNAGVIGFVLLLIWLAAKKRWKQALEAFLFLGAGTGLLLLMQIRGRLPERVVYSLSLVLFVTMLLNLVWNMEELWEARKVMRRACLCGMAVCTLLGIYGCTATLRSNQLVIEKQKELELLQEYCRENSEKFYFVTGDVLSGYGEVIGSPVKRNETMNYISTGDWISFSPLEDEKLVREGVTSAAEALLENPGTRLIAVKDSANLKYITDYLSLRAGREITAAAVEELTESYVVYKFK